MQLEMNSVKGVEPRIRSILSLFMPQAKNENRCDSNRLYNVYYWTWSMMIPFLFQWKAFPHQLNVTHLYCWQQWWLYKTISLPLHSSCIGLPWLISLCSHNFDTIYSVPSKSWTLSLLTLSLPYILCAFESERQTTPFVKKKLCTWA